MSIDERLHALGRDARTRRITIALLLGAPVGMLATAWSARIAGLSVALVVAAACCAIAIMLARRAALAIDDAWIARRLDASHARFEDSADLLFRDAQQLSSLQRLQRSRLHARLQADPIDDIAPAWPGRLLGVVWILSLVAVAAALLLPRQPMRDPGSASAPPTAADASATHIDRVQLDITAPAYTKIASRSEPALEARAAAGSRIGWHLRFTPAPTSAALMFHDGSRVELARSGAEWVGERTLAASALYRIVLDGAPPVEDDRLRRLDAIADQPPDVRVIQPEKSLTLLEDGQNAWDLAFEASDDYGIATANLTVTLAQGTGENIAFKEQTVALDGENVDSENAGRHLRYRHRLDLAALGIAKGDDVIVRLAVGDNREPQANTTKSASFILRWPPEAASDSVGMAGILQKTMPAYFRSQRQIVIDTEALIAEQAKLSDDQTLARSDSIGVDQKVLRLRYGQFLGEEFETRSAPASPAEGEHAKEGKSDARADALTDHDHAAAAEPASKFGDAGDVMAEYGHTHDHAEAATLLDPETKAILKSALNEMWQSELHLRQGRPADALPFEYKALEYIKQVQQSTRIYLARVGLELPAIDEGRRLSGDRKGVTDRESALVPADAGDSAAIALWHELDDRKAPDLDAFERWVHAHESTMPDALALLAAADRVRREPACEECRRQLRSLLWPLLPQPATVVQPRIAPDAGGRAYLDAMRTEPAAGTGHGEDSSQ
jgi:hypothetical protein